MYQEEQTSTVTHNGQEYSINGLLRIASKKPITLFPTNTLAWILKYTTLYADRIKVANYTFPLLVTIEDYNNVIVLDGAHRLARAVLDNIQALPCIILTQKEIESTLVKK